MKIKVTPFETYKTFIAMKSHFMKDKYDYIKFGNRLSKLTINSFYK